MRHDQAARRNFASWTQDNDIIVDSVWFSEEAHFTLEGHVNKRNFRYWSEEKPVYFHEKPLHCEKVTAWIALSSSGIIEPYFCEVGGVTATVTSGRYLHMLKNKFMPELRRRGINLQYIYFQQDGAAPHTAVKVLEWLQETFDGKLIALKTDTEWPPHSPDLNPLDFFLWGHLKAKVYNPPPTTLQELKRAIRREASKIDTETCEAVIRNFRTRFLAVKRKRGGHVEHVL